MTGVHPSSLAPGGLPRQLDSHMETLWILTGDE